MMTLVCSDCGQRFESDLDETYPKTVELRLPGGKTITAPTQPPPLAMLEMLRCPDCDAKAAAYRKAEAVQTQQDAAAERLKASGIPAEFAEGYDAALGNLPLMEFCKQNARHSLWLQSVKSGCCKTRTLAFLAAKLVKVKGVDAKFYKASALVREYSGLLGESVLGAHEFIRKLAAVRLLIIDDLGAEKLTERGVEAVFEILDARLEAGRPTWLSSNLSGSELEAKLGERGPYLRRRLVEGFMAYDADRNVPLNAPAATPPTPAADLLQEVLPMMKTA